MTTLLQLSSIFGSNFLSILKLCRGRIMLVSVLLLQSGLQATCAEREVKIETFLKSLVAIHPISNGTIINFTGKYLEIPSDLKNELHLGFPNYNFTIARMTYLHWGPDPMNLIIVTDVSRGEVITYLWDIWFNPAPFTFPSIFSREIKGSERQIHDQLSTLSKLIAYSMGGRIGAVKESNDFVTAEVYDRQEKLLSILRIETKQSYGTKGLIFMNPKSLEEQ